MDYSEDQGEMQILYGLTNLFLRPIIKPDLLPPQIMEENNQSFDDIFNLIIDNLHYNDILIIWLYL